MSRRALLWTIPALLALTGCGSGGYGSGSSSYQPTSTPMDSAQAGSVTTSFLVLESTQASSAALPMWQPGGGDALGLAMPTLPGCVTVANGGVDGNGFTHLTWTYTGCSGPDGGTLNGTVAFTFKVDSVAHTGDYTLTYTDLVAAKGTQSWTFNGSRHLALNLATQQATVTVSAFTAAYADSAAPGTGKTYAYACNLTSDWATASHYKLWGNFSFQSGSESPLQATIDAGAPLDWTAACCYPTAGTVKLQQGAARADITFTSTCGAIQIAPFGQGTLNRTLAACS